MNGNGCMKVVESKSIIEVKGGIILQQVNCQGVMGSGVAAAIRSKWPNVFDDYKAHCSAYRRPSDMLGSINVSEVEEGLFVVNLFGQLNYGRDVTTRYTSYDALDEALSRTRRWMIEHDLDSSSVHHPAIGSGLGGGHWPTVASLIHQRLGSDTTLWLYP